MTSRPATTPEEATSSFVELVEDPSRSCGTLDDPLEDPLDGSLRDNLLVHGENLATLRALAPVLAGQVRCVYIDPPYNTGASFEHYDDDADHAHWLASMRARLALLRELLTDDGLLFVQIDDRECAYLQVLLDELFGRARRLNVVVVKMSERSGLKMAHADRRLPKLKEYLLVYGKTARAALRPLRVEKTGAAFERYLRYYAQLIENPDDPVERWRVVGVKDAMRRAGMSTDEDAVRAYKLANAARVVYRTNNRALAMLRFDTPTARVVSPTGRDYVWWEGKQMLFLADHVDEGLGDLWTDLSTINLNKEGGVAFPNGKKPEALVRRVLQLATEPGDWVLDAYGGSGTTAAVAHKMGRRWITIEQGPQAATHCAERLRRVVEGRDEGGVTRDEGWRGGGGFRFVRAVEAGELPPRGACPLRPAEES